MNPVSKPRMVRGDRWKMRDCCARYWTYKDELRSRFSAQELPEHYWLIFHIPMPQSWSKKKRSELNASPHRSKPDKDNLEKGFLDALFSGDDDLNDCQVWDGRVTKLWAEIGAIEVLEIVDPIFFDA